MKKLTYSTTGDNYETKDPVKKLAQTSARATGVNLRSHGFAEVSDSRGESAYVWRQGNVYMATTIEGLGTKNLVADGMYPSSRSGRPDNASGRKTYYDVIAHDTVATIINDLVSVGAEPLTIHAYWAIEDNAWLADMPRMKDLITGWKKACDIAGASWGGGETPTMKGIVIPGTCELGGSAVGMIKNKKHLMTDRKLRAGDRILLMKSNGVNANGISLARAIAKRLLEGYATRLPNGKTYGESLLTKSNIYAGLVRDLLRANLDIHYISNITGHGLRKVMRARGSFTYVIEKLFAPQPIFSFIQEHAKLSEAEMYETYNMGQDYAIFLPAKDMKKALAIVKRSKFVGLDAGYVEKGERQVVLKQKDMAFKGESLDLR